jgi:hypothetical protein
MEEVSIYTVLEKKRKGTALLNVGSISVVLVFIFFGVMQRFPRVRAVPTPPTVQI